MRNTAVQGSTVTLTCIANGFPAPKYIISRNGTQVIQNGGKYIITNIQLNAEYDRYECHSFNDEGPGPNETLLITVESKYQGLAYTKGQIFSFFFCNTK